MKRLFVGIATCSLCMLPFMAWEAHGQDSISAARSEKMQLEQEIAALEKKIKATDSLIVQENEHISLLQKRLATTIDKKKKAIAELREKVTVLEKEIRTVSGSIEAKRAQARSIASRRTYLTTRLIEQCGALEQEVARSLPWNREERLSRVRALKSDLENGTAQLDDGLARLLSLLEEETAFGDEIVLGTRTIRRNDGTSVSARVLRLGNLWMAYVDASEEQYGILNRESDTTFSWREEVTFTEREQIRTAIRVKESKKAPQIVPLPLKVSVTQGKEN